MNCIWEPGDEVIRRYAGTDEFRERQYVLNAIAKGKGPFLDLRRIACPDGRWLFLYRANGCQDLKTALKRDGNGREVFLPAYLKLMLLVLKAMDLAEEQMISPSVFVIDAETVFYHGDTDSVRFACVPCRRRERSAGELMLGFSAWIETIDPGFDRRWPLLKTTFEELREAREGRGFLRKILRKWQEEFPQTGRFRNGVSSVGNRSDEMI